MDNIKEYKQQNDELLKYTLDNTWFKAWRRKSNQDDFLLPNYGSIEFALDPSCDLNCWYCYYNKYGKELYQGNLPKKERILKNLEAVLNFLYKNGYSPEIELFAGEVFKLPYVWDVFNLIYKYQKKTKKQKRTTKIMIPTNMSILKEETNEKYMKFINYKKKFEKLGIKLVLSASVDGPLMDYINRPPKNKKNKYNVKFYNRLKKEFLKGSFGVHPMIYSQNIEYWTDNFLWFMEGATSTPPIYLLEIRNAQWSEKQVRGIHYFMRYLVHWLYKKVNFSKEKLIETLKETHGFNILYHFVNKIGRGLGCSLQSGMHIQIDSLKLSPCHRVSYDNLVTGQFKFNKDGSYEIESKNVEFFLATQTTDASRLIPCETCAINILCTGSCLGANIESTGDPFTVPPSLCRLEYMKISGAIMGFYEVGILDYFLDNIKYDFKRTAQIEHIIDTIRRIENGK